MFSLQTFFNLNREDLLEDIGTNEVETVTDWKGFHLELKYFDITYPAHVELDKNENLLKVACFKTVLKLSRVKYIDFSLKSCQKSMLETHEKMFREDWSTYIKTMFKIHLANNISVYWTIFYVFK